MIVVITPGTDHVGRDTFAHPARQTAFSAPPGQNDFVRDLMRQLVDHQRVELRIAFRTPRSPIGTDKDNVVVAAANDYTRNLFRRQWTRRCKLRERHFRGEDEVQTRADPGRTAGSALQTTGRVQARAPAG